MTTNNKCSDNKNAGFYPAVTQPIMASERHQNFDQQDKTSFFFWPGNFKRLTSVELEKAFKKLKKDSARTSVVTPAAAATLSKKRPASPNTKATGSDWVQPRKFAKIRGPGNSQSSQSQKSTNVKNQFAPLANNDEAGMETDENNSDESENPRAETKKNSSTTAPRDECFNQTGNQNPCR